MMKFNKKIAFSLAESLISMMVLTLVVLLTMSSITRKKVKPISKTTISGMYACWHPKGKKLRQAKYDGNRKVFDTNNTGVPGGCEFIMDRRVTNYYVVAVGSIKCVDSNCINGQMVEDVIATPGGEDQEKMKIKINLGYSSGTADDNGGTTTVVHEGNESLKAIGGIIKNPNNELVDGNIELCKYFGGAKCDEGNPYCSVSNSSMEYIKNKNPIKTEIQIQCKDDEGYKLSSWTVPLREITPGTNGFNGEFRNENDNDGTGPTKNINVKLQEKDPALKADASFLIDSEFAKFLKALPKNRQNKLYDDIIEYYVGGSIEKNGIVLILW